MWLLLQCWSPSNRKVHMLFPFSCLCKSPGPSGAVIHMYFFCFLLFFAQEGAAQVVLLPPVVTLLYSNLFPILERSQTSVKLLSCPWVRTRTYRLKNLEFVCSNRSHVSQSLFLVSLCFYCWT